MNPNKIEEIFLNLEGNKNFSDREVADLLKKLNQCSRLSNLELILEEDGRLSSRLLEAARHFESKVKDN